MSRRENTSWKRKTEFMNRITFIRILNNGFLNYWRNFWLSAAATAIMVTTLFILSTLLILNALADVSLKTVQEKVDVSIYFKPQVSENLIFQIQKQVELLPQVKSILYIPPVTARDRFKQLHKDEPLLIESVEQFSETDNPFPASFAIRVYKLEDYVSIISLFQDDKFNPYVKKITDKREVVNRLNRIIRGIKNSGIVLSAAFSLITVIVVFNTIRLAIYNRREEIEIMRLVGASNSFIRGPFIIEGTLYGISGGIITAMILYPIYYILTPKISSFLEINLREINHFGLDFPTLFGLQLGAGVILGVISSLIVIRKYLKI